MKLDQLVTLRLKLVRCPAEHLVLDLMNIHQGSSSEESDCDGSLFLKVDR